MSSDLRNNLAALTERSCVVGIGNPEWGDDGFGVVLAESLKNDGCRDVIVAGPTPESHLGRLREGKYKNVLFLDALDFPGEPGSVIFLNAGQIRSRFPQISTHKISLGTLAAVIETDLGARVWCLGVKPASLGHGPRLSRPVEAVSRTLKDLLMDVFPPAGGTSPAG